MNRIYLDIDGVLDSKKFDKKLRTNPDFIKFNNNQREFKHLAHKFWDPKCVDVLKEIIKNLNPEIYIHSSWRHHFSLNELKSFFQNWNIDPDIIIDKIKKYQLSSERFHDISWHIEKSKKKEKFKFIIIDDLDMTDIFPEKDIFSKQIVTSRQKGLEKKHIKEAIDLINNQK